jgi:Trk K+ transport system NAD-binding subunit
MMKSMPSQLAALLNRPSSKSNTRMLFKFLLLLAFLFVAFSFVFHALMLHEGREYSWLTGFYWTLTVMSTLGFGDITFVSDIGRLFSIVVLLTGIVFLLVLLPFTFIQFFYAPWLEAQNQARAPRSVPDTVSAHVIFTQFDAVTEHLAAKCLQYGIHYVILVADLHQALDLHDRGYRVALGELDDPDTYIRLRVRQAALVVVLNDDLTSTNIIYTVREISDRVATVTNADADDSLDILQLAGSTHVFQFTQLLGQALARRVLGISMTANVIGGFDELLIAEAPAMRTQLQGVSLADSRLREKTGVTVVGIWEQGRFLTPQARQRMGESTVLVLAGTAGQLERYDRLIGFAGHQDLPGGPVLVLGGGRVGRSVAATLEARGIDFRVVEKRERIASQDQRFIQGSAADRDVLVAAGIDTTPSIIITTHDDNLNIYLTIYCRRLRPDVQIISRASLDRNINTLHRAGANLVMSYTSLCASTIMNLLKPGKLLMLSEGLNVFRMRVRHRLEGRILRDLRIREETGCSVVAVQRGERTEINPDPAIVLEREDELILIGAVESEKAFMERYATV